MVSAVVALLRYRVTAVIVGTASAAGYTNNYHVSGGTGGSGKGKSSMRDNSFGGGS